MKKVIIAEKPSVAKNIADAYNIKIRKDGYFEGDDYLVTWAFGHLFQLFDAKDYDENMKGWRMDKFPFIPEEFKYKVKCDNVNRNVTDKGNQQKLYIPKSFINCRLNSFLHLKFKKKLPLNNSRLENLSSKI